jgi:hypothetical protein
MALHGGGGPVRGLARCGLPLLVALGIGSCDASPVLFPEAASVEIMDGSGGLRGVAGEVLLPAPQVRIVDGSGNPVPGVQVTFQVTDGGGSVSGATRTSDRHGTVSLSGWTLGEPAGANTLEVRVADRGAPAPGPGAPAAVVNATGEAGPPSQIEPVVVGELQGPVGGPVEATIRFRVTDRFGNPVPGREVVFEALSESGSASPATGMTGADGVTGPVTWTLGTAAGTQGLRAAATGVSGVAVTLEAEAASGPPAELRIDGTPPAQGTVGEPVGLGVSALVLDAFGNPVSGVVVTFTPGPGSGVVSDPVGTSDEEGRSPVPEWTLGPVAGPQTLVVRAGELDPIEIQVLALAGPPASMVASNDTVRTVLTNQEVVPAPAVRVHDPFGNPVAGARVVFEGDGTISGGDVLTDSAGIARIGSWRVGPAAGEAVLVARLVPPVEGVDPVTFRATVVAPTMLLTVVAGQNQTGTVGQPTPEPVLVRLETEGGSPVGGAPLSLTVVEGGGSVSPSSVVTAANGVAAITGWTLGPEPGTNRLRVQGASSNAAEIVATAEAFQEPEPSPYAVEAVHLNQGNQTLLGEIALVAGRDGLLRIFLRGDEPSPGAVRVRVRLRHGSAVVLDATFGREGNGGIGTGGPEIANLGASWNLEVPGALVQPGLSMRVDVDPDGVLGLPQGSIGWPAAEGWASPVVVQLPTFRATFIPVHVEDFELTGRITPGNVAEYTAMTLDAFPIGASDFEVRTSPFVYDGSFENPSDGWIGVLQDIRDLRLAEGALDRYYHGILQRPPGPGVAGIAYVATQPLGIQNLAAVSFDALPTAGPVIAHEFGHNFGRYHAPCGVTSGLDGAFPYPDGGLGFPGFSAAAGELRLDGPYHDVMSYCFPLWPSDYTYESILMMRDARPVGAPRPAWAVLDDAPSAPVEGLLVGGSWSPAEGAFLRPVLAVHAPATPGSAGGDVHVAVVDAAGRTLAEGRYHGAPVDHADDPELRHFGIVVPVPAGAEPARIIATTPFGRSEWAVPATSDAPEIALSVESGAASGPAVRLRWDAESWPVLVVRSEATGEIVGFLRSGSARVPLPLAAAGVARFEALAGDAVATPSLLRELGLRLEASNGVQSRPLPDA